MRAHRLNCEIIGSTTEPMLKETCKVKAGQSTIGGCILPREASHTWLLALVVSRLYRSLGTLLQSQVPIIARIKNNLVLFNPRIILPEQKYTYLHGIQHVLENVL